MGGFRRKRYKGLERTGLAGYLVATAYNLVRMAKLLGLQRKHQNPRWHDLRVGYPCPAYPEGRIEVAAEAKSPVPTPQFHPRGP